MKFEEALAAMREGKRVRRICWMPERSVRLDGVRIEVKQEKYDSAEAYHEIPLSWLVSQDWEIVEDAPLILPTDDGAVEAVARQLHKDTRRGVEGWMDVPEENRAYFRHSAERVLRALREYASQKV